MDDSLGRSIAGREHKSISRVSISQRYLAAHSRERCHMDLGLCSWQAEHSAMPVASSAWVKSVAEAHPCHHKHFFHELFW